MEWVLVGVSDRQGDLVSALVDGTSYFYLFFGFPFSGVDCCGAKYT